MGPLRWFLVSCMLLGSSLAFALQNDAARQDDEAVVATTGKYRAVPRVLRFAGELRTAAGTPRTGTVALTFALYGEREGGAPFWVETQNVVLDSQGRYVAIVGRTSDTGLPLRLFAGGEARWLGVRVAEEGGMEQPRVALVSVPYALAAADAQLLNGRPATDYQLTRAAAQASGDAAAAGVETSGTVSSAGNTAGKIAKFTGTDAVGDSVITENGGNIGVNIATPAATLSLGPAVGEKFDFYQSLDGSIRLGIGIDQVNGPRELNLFTTSPTVNGSGRITLGYRREDNGQFVGNVTILNSGNMGVGTSNPAATLSLGPAVGEKFDFYQSPDSSVRLGIGIDQVNPGRELNLFTSSPTVNGAGRITLGYRREDNGQFVGNMTILNSGNVGVGTSDPAATLSLGPAVGEKFDFYQSADSTIRLGIGIDQVNGPRELNLFTTSPTLNGSGRITLGYRREDNGQFVGNVAILNGGNVGIGSVFPSQRLEVAGTIYSTTGGFKFPDGSVQTTAATGGGAGDITAVIAGTGLSGGATSGDATLSVNTGTIQSRVTGTCATGNYVRVINQDGSVTCGTDQTGAGGIVYPYASGSQSTTSGAFTVTQTNSVVLQSDPTFASAQSGIPAGLVGVAGATANTAVGVAGFSSAPEGPAVVGWNGSTASVNDPDASGVLGITDNPSGKALMGEAHSATGESYGLLAQAASTSGTGVKGRAIANTGFTFGVIGEVNSQTGTAAYLNAPTIGTAFLVRGGPNGGPDKFKVDGNGTVFAAAYKDLAGNPIGGGGSGTITGVTAGAGLTGGGTSGTVGLAVDATVARTNANNNFTTSQNVTGNFTATGDLTALSGTFAGLNGGLWGEDTTVDSVARVGVQGFSWSTAGSGVSGWQRSTTGLTSGVSGRADSNNGAGVFGRAISTTGTTAGVRGVAMSTSGNGVRGDMMAPTVGAAMTGGNGVLGSYGLNQDFTNNANATGGIGVIGLNFAPGGTGIQGEATGTGSTIGLYAKATSSTGTAAIANNTGGGTILRGQNNGTDKFRVDGTGDVVVNGGDLATIVQGKGIVLRATDGANCFRITVNNAGTLTTASVTCPN